MSGVALLRLMQAVAEFKERTKGGTLPKGVAEAVDALEKAVHPGGEEGEQKLSPGAREVAKLVPGTRGTGEPISIAARGHDGPSPGQRAAQSAAR